MIQFVFAVLKCQNSCGHWRTSVEAKQGTAIMGNARPMVLNIFSCFYLQSCFQVAHIPGALFFDVDGISDRTSSVSSALLLVHLLLITTKSYKLHVSTYRCLFALFSLLILF